MQSEKQKNQDLLVVRVWDVPEVSEHGLCGHFSDGSLTFYHLKRETTLGRLQFNVSELCHTIHIVHLKMGEMDMWLRYSFNYNIVIFKSYFFLMYIAYGKNEELSTKFEPLLFKKLQNFNR